MSVSVPGNIECALQLEVKENVAKIWDETGVKSAEYIATVDAAKAITDNQTARMTVLEDADKDRQLKVYWPDDCRTDVPVDCVDECDVEGPMAGTQCVDYALNECFGYSWGISEKTFRTSELEPRELEAVMLLKAMKQMDEMLDRKAIMLFDVTAGVNKYPGPYQVSGTTTFIPATAWTPDLFGYFAMVFRKNKLTLPKMLSGDLLWMQYWKMEMETTDPTGQSAAKKFRSIGGVPYFDIEMDAVLDPTLEEKAAFLFNGASLVIANQARHSGKNNNRLVPTPTGPVFWSTMESKNIPGITYDLFRKETCVDGDISTFNRLQFRGAFLSNPLGCDDDRTGVLKMQCGVAP